MQSLKLEHKEIAIAEALNSLLARPNPLALWRLPFQSAYHCVLSKQNALTIDKVNLEEINPGFVIAPFENSEAEPILFIPADEYTCFDAFHQPVSPRIYDYLQNTPEIIRHQMAEPPAETTPKSVFLTNVAQAIGAIGQGEFEKVVLSRRNTTAVPVGFNPIAHFEYICAKYPELFCSLVYLPSKHAIWIGASPEILIKQAKGKFETMALAGTQAAYNMQGQLISNTEALWRQKEIEEQALVSRYIINCFKKIRVREFQEIGPKTVKAGNLLHLQTRFIVDTTEINFPQLATVMLDLLHPTSAVCGMPKEPALQFIRSHESQSRGLYSGFLGPIHINQESQLFVNLRSLRLSHKQISCFAGCGITSDSDPEKEWLETEIKLTTISPIGH